MVEISSSYGVYPNKMNVTSRKVVYAKQVPPKIVDLQAKQATSVASENTPSACRLGIPAQQKLSQQYIPPTRNFLSFLYPCEDLNPVGVLAENYTHAKKKG